MTRPRVSVLSKALSAGSHSYALCAAGVGAAMACALAAPILPYSTSAVRWLVELGGHWVWPATAVALFAAWRGRGWAGYVSVAAAGAGIVSLAFAYSPIDAADSKAPRLRVASSNIFVGNKDASKLLLPWIAERKPDVLMVQEVSPAMAAELEKLADYPHRMVVGRVDGFGIALLSKHPLANVRLIPGEGDTPAIGATMTWQGKEVELVAAHPLPPITASLYARRNHRLAQLADGLAQGGKPAIIAGDFNATPWSSGVKVVEERGLRRATSPVPTWPAQLGPFALIPIDQVMVSKDWAVVGRQRGPDVGSDHFPVEVDLSLSSANAASL